MRAFDFESVAPPVWGNGARTAVGYQSRHLHAKQKLVCIILCNC